MKKLKFTSTLLLALTLSATAISAQTQQRKAHYNTVMLSPEQIAETSTDRLDQQLKLTDAQESKIYAINLKYAQERKAKADKAKAQREGDKKAPKRDGKAIMEAMQASKKAQLTEVMAILTDAQKVDYALLISKDNANNNRKVQGGNQGRHKQNISCKRSKDCKRK